MPIITRFCVKCGADISAPHLRRKTLCPDCKRTNDLDYKKRYREERKERKCTEMIACVICGNDFPRYSNIVTCSPECRIKREKQRRKMAHRNYYLKTERKARGISDTCICIICGGEFPRHEQTKTCSLECKEVQRENWRLTAKAKRETANKQNHY